VRPTNRRPAFPLDAQWQFGRALHAQPCSSAALAELGRSVAKCTDAAQYVQSLRVMRIVALTIVLAAGGCAHNEKLSEQPTQAASQIQSWVPVGTSLADAQHIMQQHHFTCSVMTNSSFGDSKAVVFLYCDRHVADRQATRVVVRRWQVALIVSDGKISAVRLSTGLSGL
jgi:hypothetical protein